MIRSTRVLICGDRNWRRYDIILATLKKLHEQTPIDVVIEGECRGADLLGKRAAYALGIVVSEFPAQWDVHGLAAGPIRNAQMLREGKPTLVLAFHDDLSNSKGTAHMVKIAKAAGVPVQIITQRSFGAAAKGADK